jgi:hypothetical protein
MSHMPPKPSFLDFQIINQGGACIASRTSEEQIAKDKITQQSIAGYLDLRREVGDLNVECSYLHNLAQLNTSVMKSIQSIITHFKGGYSMLHCSATEFRDFRYVGVFRVGRFDLRVAD